MIIEILMNIEKGREMFVINKYSSDFYKDLGLFENNKDLSALHKNLSGIRNAESSGSTEHTHKL